RNRNAHPLGRGADLAPSERTPGDARGGRSGTTGPGDARRGTQGRGHHAAAPSFFAPGTAGTGRDGSRRMPGNGPQDRMERGQVQGGGAKTDRTSESVRRGTSQPNNPGTDQSGGQRRPGDPGTRRDPSGHFILG